MTAPVTILLVAVATLAFQAMIFGEDLVENSIIATVDAPDCTGDLGPLETIACWVRSAGVAFLNVFIVIGSIVKFFFNAITFNIPGAPILVRVLVGTLFIGSVGWAIANLFRGSSA